MEDVDFSAAELHWVEFWNLVLDRVRWPEDGNHVVIPHQARAVLRRANELITELGTPHAAGLSGRLDQWHPDREVAVWHRSELGNDEVEQGAAVKVLRRAEGPPWLTGGPAGEVPVSLAGEVTRRSTGNPEA
jgi:hypothetical protein